VLAVPASNDTNFYPDADIDVELAVVFDISLKLRLSIKTDNYELSQPTFTASESSGVVYIFNYLII